jgi:hypothetical protein
MLTAIGTDSDRTRHAGCRHLNPSEALAPDPQLLPIPHARLGLRVAVQAGQRPLRLADVWLAGVGQTIQSHGGQRDRLGDFA